MPRTKGAKDRTRRAMKPESMSNLANPVPGYASASVRIYAPTGDVRWFKQLDSRERGEAVTNARRLQ